MKKLINKLFEWLGYKVVKKEKWDELIDKSIELNMYHNWNLLHKGLIIDDKVIYIMSSTLDRNHVVVIMKSTRRAFPLMIIKAFPYSKEEDYEYARMCAEELCEMLNEKY